MKNEFNPIIAEKKEVHGTFKMYLIGFTLSIALTFAAFLVVIKHLIPNEVVDYALGGLAIIQALVQLLFFFHLGNDSKPHWNLIVFFFMTLVLAILVIGSLWIMYSLDYRVMSFM